MVIGYTTGVFDLFHIGHLNMLKNAASLCDKLIVGVTTDELLLSYKNKRAVIPFHERKEIIRNIKCVDAVVPQYDMNKIAAQEQLNFDIMFVGSDWYGTDKWKKIESDLAKKNVRVVYFPYTEGTSSTLINETLENLRK